MGVRICGTGCSLVDYLYTGVPFDSDGFRRYQSRAEGDGGLEPGKLVFAGELERFAGVPFATILRDVVGDRPPDATNLGGPAIVALIHAAQMTSDADIEVRFYGARGDDESGRTISEIVERTPVVAAGYGTRPGRTPFTNVFSDPTYDNGHGERTFVNALGVAAEYGPDDIPPEFFDADVVSFGGTALVPMLHDALTPLLSRAKDSGAMTVVNTVYDFRAEKRDPARPWPLGDTEKSLPLIDLLITDREEALRISGESDAERAAARFARGGVHSCIVTQGSDDGVVASDGTVFGEVDLRRLPICERVRTELRADPGRAGDTTGCGDNFVGGLLASIAHQLTAPRGGGLDIIEACSWAVASGGFACYYVGGTYLESEAGEKRARVTPYYRAYREQIR